MDQLLTFLHSIYPLPDALRERLQKILKEKKLLKGEWLLREGDINRDIFFIGKGLLRCFYLKDPLDVSAWFMKEGDVVVSIESFYDQVRSYECIEALEDCELFYISYEELKIIYQDFMEFNFIGRILTIKYLKLWTRQLYNLRMQSASERYLFLLHKDPELIQRVPNKYMASYLGIADSTLCRIKLKQRSK